MSRLHEKYKVPARLGNWVLQDNLGAGYSGSIWKAVNPFTCQSAAVKVQDVDHECPTNRYERNFYPALQGGKGMPTLWAAGVQGDHDYLVIDLLGPSLDNLYRKNGKTMDLRSTVSIAMQVIERLEFMHMRGILHRDIQLGNCVLGLGALSGVIYMIDFGFSKRYIDGKTHAHIPDSKAKRDFIGNYWFSSVNVHCRGKVPSRRDDMEALALMLIHLQTDGGLPWTRNGVPKNNEQHEAIIRQKLRARPEDLCRGLPPVFEDFLRSCRSLKFFDKPDYERWRDEFRELADEMGFRTRDGVVKDDFIWPPIPEEKPPPYSAYSPARTDKKSGAMVEKGFNFDDILDVINEVEQERKDGRLVMYKGDLRRQESVEKLKKRSERDREKRVFAKQNVVPTIQKKKKPPSSPEVIVISSSDDDSQTLNSKDTESEDESNEPDSTMPSRRTVASAQHERAAKQSALRELVVAAQKAATTPKLALCLLEFLDIMTNARSKVITLDAFDFLETVAYQLEYNSSLKGGPRTTSKGSFTEESKVGSRLRQRSVIGNSKGLQTVREVTHRMQKLPRDASKEELAKILNDYCTAVRVNSSRTLTKDGMIFFDNLESRLRGS